MGMTIDACRSERRREVAVDRDDGRSRIKTRPPSARCQSANTTLNRDRQLLILMQLPRLQKLRSVTHRTSVFAIAFVCMSLTRVFATTRPGDRDNSGVSSLPTRRVGWHLNTKTLNSQAATRIVPTPLR